MQKRLSLDAKQIGLFTTSFLVCSHRSSLLSLLSIANLEITLGASKKAVSGE